MFLRKIIFKPKKNDGSMSSQFFYADEELTAITDELDSFDGHKEPERCTQLVNKLRSSQDKLLVIVDSILHEELGPHCATSRDFRVKFPDDVLQEGLRGQLWFGAECLAAGSSILNREPESNCMRPLAKAMTMKLAKLRKSLRDQCLKNGPLITERIQEDLIIFDRLFADFELSYVSAMVHIKSIKEYDRMQDVIVLFSETTQRALKKGLLTQEMLDDYDPALMFTIPRLAIVCGLLTYPDGPLNPDMDPIDMSDMFRPFQTLMYKIRELLCTLSEEELAMLEKSLCSTDEVTPVIYQRSLSTSSTQSNKQAKTLSQQAQSAAKAAASAGDTRPVGVSSVDTTSAVHDTADSHHHQASRDNNAGMVTAESSVMSSPDLALLATASSSDNVAGSEVCDVDICGVDGITCLRHSKSWPNTQTSGAVMHDTVSVQHDSEDTPVCSGGVCSRCDSMECVCTSRAYRNIPNTHATVVTASSSSQRHRMSGDAVIPDDASSSGDEELDANVPQMLGELLDTDTELPCDSRSQFEQSLEQIQQRTCDTTSNSDIVTTTSTTHSNDNTVISNNNNTSSTGSNNSELNSGMKILEDSLSSEPGDKIDMSVCDIVHVHAAAAAAVHAADTTTTSSVDEDSSDMRGGQDSQHGVINAGQHHHRSATEVGVEEHKADVVLQEIGSLQIADRSPERKDDDQRSVTSFAGDDSKEQSSRNPAEEEITVAIQEAELAARREARSRYKSSADMMHRLFVCISGVADQLQTNYAADLRQILKVVFECNSGDDDDVDMSITAHVAAGGNGSTGGDAQQGDDEGDDSDVVEATEDIVDASMGVSGAGERYHEEDYITSTGTDAVAGDGGAVTEQEVPHRRTAPAWVPDEAVLQCTSCTAPFTFVRRRHHCRNCGKIFCGRCSSNYVSLPHFGHDKPVRVCMHCYTFEVTPFTAST